jgi:AcrR family transcriptional regulator
VEAFVPDNNQATGRADRILDAAGELLLRFGHRKVTIDDIAKQARIGKGTVYLHWRTKGALFQSLMLRESVVLLAEILDSMRRDPAEVLPHRLARASFVLANQKPLVRAVLTKDIDLLGNLVDSSVRGHEDIASEQYFNIMVRHGLMRADLPNLAYSFGATMSGFYLIDNLDPAAAELDLQTKADALADTIRHAFEPPHQPDAEVLASAASEITTVFEELIPPYHKGIYPHDPVD